MKQFLLFTFYMIILCLYNIIIYCYEGIECLLVKLDVEGASCHHKDLFSIGDSICNAFVGILNFLIGMFCVCLFVSQLHLLAKNSSFIDDLKQRKEGLSIELELASKLKSNEDLINFQKKSFCQRLKEDVFGDTNYLWWFLPVLRLKEENMRVENELS